MSKLLKHAHPARILLPVLIGVGVVLFFLYKDFDVNAFRQLVFSWKSALWILAALLFMAGRDFGYIWRIRLLCNKEINWRQAFRIIMLWEFTSAVTPSAVGGTSVAVLYVHKEGISVGRSSAIVMATSLLDEFYFIIMFPLLLLLVGSHDLFSVGGKMVTNSLFTLAWVGYSLKLSWTILLTYGMFFNPKAVSRLIVNIFRLPILRRWKAGAEKAGLDIINCSAEFRQQRPAYWAKAFLSTFLSWTSRYFVVNALLLAFFPVEDHLMLFARQLVMWLILLVTPTPGGSGFAEYIFKYLLGGFIPLQGLSYGFALLWRIITYYPYLFIGAVIFPRWAVSKFSRKT